MGKLRVYVTNSGGTTLTHEETVPAFAEVEVKSGEDAFFEGALTNAQAIGPETSNEDDVAVFITQLEGEDLEKAQAKHEKEAEAEHKKLVSEAEKAAKESGEPVEVEMTNILNADQAEADLQEA